MFGMFKRKIKFPSPDWHDKMNARFPNTPDMHLLEQHWHQLLFVCDEMHGHELLKDQEYMADAYTQDHFQMPVRRLGKLTYPIPLAKDEVELFERVGNEPLPKLNIFGHIYAVNPQRFYKLDKHRENLVQFNRRRVDVIIPYTKIWSKDPRLLRNVFGEGVHNAQFKYSGVLRHPAWMYFGINEYWDALIDDGYTFGVCGVCNTNNDVIKQCYNFDPPF